MQRLLPVVALLFLSACAAMRGDLAAPDIALTGLHMGQGDGMSQTVLIDLLISNPNDSALTFNAISYRVRIGGRDLVSGSSREPLQIAAHGTQKYTVPATLSLMSGFGLVRDLLAKPKDKIPYELSATLEPTGLFSLPITVRKADMVRVR